MTQALPQTIHRVLGSNNLLLLVPGGYNPPQSDQAANYIADLALSLTKQLECYGVINTKYKEQIMDLTDLQVVENRPRVKEDFLLPIIRFQKEISGNGLPPLLLMLHPLPAEERPESMLLLGYGQGERSSPHRPHRPTIPASLLSKIRISLEDNHLSTALVDAESPRCGHQDNHLNQLFRSQSRPDLFNPEVNSLICYLRHDLISEQQTALSIATILGESIKPFLTTMSLVRTVDINSIDTGSSEDLQFIFRLQGDSRYVELMRESYIEELAQSIDRNGLLHPLVLLKKNNGRYKILCGYRRYQALKRLGKHEVEAKVYQESDFAVEDFFNISLAENTKRRNLNPIEIGNFLESAASSLGLNNAELAEQFGATLGIGKPGQKVSHSTIHKYRKVNQIRLRGESPEIISDVVNEKLQFSIASEVLAPLKNSKDRDALYLEVIRPFGPTRPQLTKIISLLRDVDPELHLALAQKKVQQSLAKSLENAQPVIALLKSLASRSLPSKNVARSALEDRVSNLRSTIFGEKATKRDFNATASSKTKKDELIIQFRLKKGQEQDTLLRLQKALQQNDLFDESVSK
ncbi:ParB/RepB/Spo0J family partition protein [Desulfobulbus rhabdoformis]|uniref:ParB/RepB/Spo0J family partition protein n=1 Tax=Desulfobulbus rhabdoformis TaxID=34032 RepID=UPI0019633BAA|nr:ParB/RepB/Spo0J family partition protein [Desulfobulbus rhabdoformis]MBM9614307.1 ParB/RepB/Spo0J family partition protein [Desulfobulbus rhabdoformis]